MFITGTAMVCPVGLDVASACAAKRAGISAFGNLSYCDNDGEPVVGAIVPGLDGALPRSARLLALLASALRDLLGGQPDLPWDQVPLLVALAEPSRPGGGAYLAPSLMARLQNALGVRFHLTHSRVYTSGHVAGFQALHKARQLIQRNQSAACVVCGVDSLLNASTLFWLDRNYRLKTPANRDGVVPGEASAAVLIGAARTGDASTEVIGLGFGKEEAPILSEAPLLGRGLADAARAALTEANLGLHQIDLRLSDVTGELYGFKELSLLEGRLMRIVRKQAQPVWHWAEAIGDIGATAGIAELALADEAFRKGYAPGNRMLCLASSAEGRRAAAVLRKVDTDSGLSDSWQRSL